MTGRFWAQRHGQWHEQVMVEADSAAEALRVAATVPDEVWVASRVLTESQATTLAGVSLNDDREPWRSAHRPTEPDVVERVRAWCDAMQPAAERLDGTDLLAFLHDLRSLVAAVGTAGGTEQPAEPDQKWHLVDERDPACVKEWPECASGEYDPRCCRFPKSCSAGFHGLAPDSGDALAAAPDHQAEAPSAETLIGSVRSILAGIDRDEVDDGWWETSTGVEFGARKLAEIEEAITAALAAGPVVDDAAVERVQTEVRRHSAGYLDLDHVDRGGLRCLCGDWSAPIAGRTRPWDAYWRHEAEAVARAALGTEGGAQ